MRVYLDRRGRVRGYSISGWTAFIVYTLAGAALFAIVFVVFAWPFLLPVPEAVKIALTALWNVALLLVALAVRRALRRHTDQ